MSQPTPPTPTPAGGRATPARSPSKPRSRAGRLADPVRTAWRAAARALNPPAPPAPSATDEPLPAYARRMRATRPRWQRAGFVALLAALVALLLGPAPVFVGGLGLAVVAANWPALSWAARAAGGLAALAWAVLLLGWRGGVPLAGLAAFARWFLADPPAVPAVPASPGPAGPVLAPAAPLPGAAGGETTARPPAPAPSGGSAITPTKGAPAMRAAPTGNDLAATTRPPTPARAAPSRVWPVGVAWPRGRVRLDLARRVGYAVLPDHDFDAPPDDLARYAQLLAATRQTRRPVARPAAALRVRLDATRDGRLLYRIEGPAPAEVVLRTATWPGHCRLEPPGERLACLLPADPSARTRLRVACAELVLAGPPTGMLATGVLLPDPLGGFARVAADLDPAHGERASVAVDLLPLTPPERAALLQALRATPALDQADEAAMAANPAGGPPASRRGQPARRPPAPAAAGTGRIAARLAAPEPLFELQVLVQVASPAPDRAAAYLDALVACFAPLAGSAWLAARPATDPASVAERLHTGRFAPARPGQLVTPGEVAAFLKPPTRAVAGAVRAGGLEPDQAPQGTAAGRRMTRRLAGWDQLADQAGLAGSRVQSAQADQWGWTVRLALRPGQTAEDAEDRRRKLDSALGVRPGSVRVQADRARADRAVLRVLERDPLAASLPWAGPTIRSVLDPVPLGPFEDGTPMLLPVAGQCVLIAGLRGSGKSGVLNVCIAELAACPDVVLWGLDLKHGLELGPWAPRFDRVARTVPEAEALLEAAVWVMHARGRLLDRESRLAAAANRPAAREWRPSPGRPALVVVIDEQGRLRTSSTAIAQLEEIAALGRALGVWLVSATQYPTVEVLGSSELRSQYTAHVLLRVQRRQHVNVVLGDGMAAAGWNADEIDPATPGVCYLHGPGAAAPRLGRVFEITPEQVQQTADRYGHDRRPVLDAVSAMAAGPAPIPETTGPPAVPVPADAGPGGRSHRSSPPSPDGIEDDAADEDGTEDEVAGLLDAVAVGGPHGRSAAELVRATGRGKTWVYDRLRDLARAGLVEQHHWGRWRLRDPTITAHSPEEPAP